MPHSIETFVVTTMFIAAGCASTEGSATGENTAGENPVDSGEEVTSAVETKAVPRCRSQMPTGSHRSVRTCSGRVANSRVDIMSQEEFQDRVFHGNINRDIRR
ncbi:MAG: hypothetical protein V3U59_08530 [Gammaproteobacteria bacterium]